MNDVLVRLEEMSMTELTMVYEYLTELIDYRKGQERLKKKRLKAKENLIINSQAKCSSAQDVAT